MRLAAALLALLGLAAGSGCSIVGATAGAVGAVAATTVTATGKVAAATVSTTGKVAAAAVSSSGDVTAGGLESAARLSRAGMVVVVDAGSGAVAELPWEEGMRLYVAAERARLGGAERALTLHRQGQVTRLDRLGQAPNLALRAGDVVEFLR